MRQGRPGNWDWLQDSLRRALQLTIAWPKPMPRWAAKRMRRVSARLSNAHESRWTQPNPRDDDGSTPPLFPLLRQLTPSKCYEADDPRISCLACHDPHHEVDSKSIDYDSKCQACHGGGKRGARVCKVAKNRLRHMPHAQNRTGRCPSQVLRPSDSDR